MLKNFSFLGLFLTCLTLHGGEVFVTNKSEEALNVRWSTSLSANARSSSGSFFIKANTTNEKAGRVNWLVRPGSEEAKSGIIYTITARVYDDRHSLIKEKSITKTLNSKQLFGRPSRDNLYIEISKNQSIDLFVGE